MDAEGAGTCLKNKVPSAIDRHVPEFNRGGHAQLFFESAIAILQLEGGTSAIAIPQFKEMLLRNRNFFWSPQVQVRFTSAIFGAFLAVKFGRFMKK
jgi:hypothetical protein